jgi:alpha-1,2-mannosyltransferase
MLLASMSARSESGRFGIRDAILVLSASVIVVAALGIHLAFGSEAVAKLTSRSTFDHFDFETFWYSAKAWWEGRNIYYDTGHSAVSSNPPFFTVLISPLGLLEAITAYKVYALGMLFISVGYLAWMAEELKLRPGWAVVGTVMLLLSMPLLTTLSLGQMYPILALGLVAAWIADRRDRPIAAGSALGLVITLKPSLAPVLLWPLVRRRWGMFGASIASGSTAILAGAIVVGPGATLDWLRFVANREIDEVWTNASLPGQADRLFRENEFAEPIAVLPWMVPAALVLGIGLVLLTAARVRRDPETGLWALVAASLLASPVAWENYLVLLGPGILLLIARGRWPMALLLLALQTFPSEWRLIWQDANKTVAALALTLYCFVLLVHWLAFFLAEERKRLRHES